MRTPDKLRPPMKERDNDSPANRRDRVQTRSSEPAAKPEPSVNMDELRELISLLRENGLAEFELEREGFRVRLRRGIEYSGEERRGAASTSAPAAAAAPKTSAAPIAVTSSSAPAHPGALA